MALSQNSLKTMQLNDQKAGMQGLDKEAINKIIYESSKGTPYFIHQEKRQQRIDKQAKEMLEELSKTTDAQRKESMAKMDALCAILESERDLSHSIVHIDMDAFYAAVEMLDNPDLKSKPMAVGSMSMLSTSNYEARKYGVRAAMAGFIAKKLCPNLTIVPCRFDRYRELSKKIRKVVEEYDPDYSTMGLDEVYLDLTPYIKKTYSQLQHDEFSCIKEKLSQASCDSLNEDPDNECEFSEVDIEIDERDRLAFKIVEEIRQKIFDATQLTASAGIAPNTRLAKVCSDQNKPNGQYQIRSYVNDVKKFIKDLPVKKISGIGPVQGQLLNQLGIHTCADIWHKRDIIDLLFSQKSARFYMKVALGIGSIEVKSDYVRKSIGNEETFKEMCDPKELHQKCEELCDEMIEHMKRKNLLGKVIVLKIKTSNFQVHTRNFSLQTHTCDRDTILRASKKLLDGEINSVAPEPLRLRLMGIRMANLVHESEVVDSKQAKIENFLYSASLPSNKPSEASSSATISSVCPVCHIEISSKVRDMQAHVNECIENYDTKNPGNVSMFGKSTDGGDGVEPGDTWMEHSLPHPDHGIGNQEPEEIRLVQTVKIELVCPVCSLSQKWNDLQHLNSHIDACLSRSAIRELIKEPDDETKAENPSKRKQSPKKSSCKRPKTNQNPKSKTLEHYFHK